MLNINYMYGRRRAFRGRNVLYALCFATVSLLPFAGAEASPLPDCDLHHLAGCNFNANRLVWSKDFYPAVRAFISAAKPVLPVALQSYPKSVREVQNSFGGPGDGGERGPGYYVFYGNWAHAAVLKGTVVISDDGKILGLAVLEPEDFYYASIPRALVRMASVTFWFRAGDRYAGARQKLKTWSVKAVHHLFESDAGVQTDKSAKMPPRRQIIVTYVSFVPETAK